MLSACLLPVVAGAIAPKAAAPGKGIAAHDLAVLVATHLGPDFNGVVLVRDGLRTTPVTGAFGHANFEQARPLTDTSLFQIGSISKWVTALAVLRLVDQGKLALDTPVGAYFPALPADRSGIITLRHLLSNTSGIPNGMGQAFKHDKSIANLALSHAAASARFATGPLLFAPGSGWDYSPTGWIVIAAIIEQVTGKPYHAALDQLVLQPAATSTIAVPRTPFRDLPAAALAYKAGPARELNTSPHVVFVAASGTLYASAADLARLADAAYASTLLSGPSRRELSRVVVDKEDYALGGRSKQLALGGSVRTVAWLTGAIGGSKSLLAYVPGEGKTVVVLNNTDMPQSALADGALALLHRLYD